MSKVNARMGAKVFAATLLVGGIVHAAESFNGCPPTIVEGDMTWTRIGSGWEVETCVGGSSGPVSGSVCTTESYFRYINEIGQRRSRNCAGPHWVA